MFLRLLALCAALALTACGADNKWASAKEVSRSAYITGEPPSITLFTVVSKRNGEGAHASLMIDASQRVLFDPAGTWYHPYVPERHDVHYGITPNMRKFYIDYHARETYDVVEQKIYVSPEIAELALHRVVNYGAVPKAFCANSVSSVLRGIPGFESIPATFGPAKIMQAFGRLPGVSTQLHHDGDPDNNHNVLLVQTNTD